MKDCRYKKIENCRVCGSHDLVDVLSLGDLAVSDFIDDPLSDNAVYAPLDLVLCDSAKDGCGLLQLRHTVSSDVMYRNYWYQSGINKTMTDELSDVARCASNILDLSAGDYVVDIGCNDGTLLRQYDIDDLNLVGFEPAENLVKHAEKGTGNIINDFFSFDAWHKKYGDIKAKIITAIGMFYDLDDPNKFVDDVCKVLDEEGVFIIQMMYMPFAIERNAFDGICHEHLEYYTLSSLENLLNRHSLEVFDVKMREEVNEGSVRFYIQKKGRNVPANHPSSQALIRLREDEEDLELNTIDVYKKLGYRIEQSRKKAIQFMEAEKAKGKKIHGYAASTKGNTTLQYYGITTDLLDMISDRNSSKSGKYTVSTNIPVVSEKQSRAHNPDYYFVLAWHFLPEFIERESDFLSNGGKFIVPMPDFTVIDK